MTSINRDLEIRNWIRAHRARIKLMATYDVWIWIRKDLFKDASHPELLDAWRDVIAEEQAPNVAIEVAA